MKEYRIMAYFTDIYPPRSFKRKVYKTREEAEKDFPEADEYYHMLTSRMRTKEADVKVVIEERRVTDWSESTAEPTLGQLIDGSGIIPEEVTGHIGFLLENMEYSDPEDVDGNIEVYHAGERFLQKLYDLANKLVQ